jgi:hypothetical protein
MTTKEISNETEPIYRRVDSQDFKGAWSRTNNHGGAGQKARLRGNITIVMTLKGLLMGRRRSGPFSMIIQK